MAERSKGKEEASLPWYAGYMPSFISTLACDLPSLDCSDGSSRQSNTREIQQSIRPAPFLYNDDEAILKWLPTRLPRPERSATGKASDEAFLWEVLDELNECRCNPRRYAEVKLKPLLDQYDGLMFQPLERDETLSTTWKNTKDRENFKLRTQYQPPPCATHEGRAALEEAIQVLMNASPARALQRETGMDRAAQEHAADLAQRSNGMSLGHIGTDNSKPADRLSRYGQWYEAAAEMLTFREATARGVVASLVVCDGAKARHERTALLNDDLRVTGISVAPHPTLECIVVITAAVGYGPRPLSHAARVVTLESFHHMGDDDDDDDHYDDAENNNSNEQGTDTKNQNSVTLAHTNNQRELGVAFEAVLYSVPLPHVHERILAALRDGAVNVFLDYSPPDQNALGRVHVSIAWPDRPQPTRFTAQWR